MLNPGPTEAWSVGLSAAEPDGRRNTSIAVTAATTVSGRSIRRMEPGYADRLTSDLGLNSPRATRQEHQDRADQEHPSLLAPIQKGACRGRCTRRRDRLSRREDDHPRG